MGAVNEMGEQVAVPVGRALRVFKRTNENRGPSPRPSPGVTGERELGLRLFLCIHMDTVYPADHAFQRCSLLDANTLQGPGVADAKGGLLVMLTALRAIEQSPLAGKINWEVLINPDEEIGSASSLPLLMEGAKRNRFGLLFEPATADGALIDRRKGSGNFAAVITGRSAHAGRDFAMGRNAVVAAAELAVAVHDLNRQFEGITVNVGKIEGGGPSNVVPERAVCRFNVRTSSPEDEGRVLEKINPLIVGLNQREGFSVQLHGGFHSPPKIPDEGAKRLMEAIEGCGRELNLPIQWKSSGGTCDGNKLAAAGLPNVDTMGPCGGNLHSPREYVRLDSLTERAKLAALVMLRLAEEC
jgi:glutamate carboxypeptidase